MRGIKEIRSITLLKKGSVAEYSQGGLVKSKNKFQKYIKR